MKLDQWHEIYNYGDQFYVIGLTDRAEIVVFTYALTAILDEIEYNKACREGRILEDYRFNEEFQAWKFIKERGESWILSQFPE